MERKDFAQQIIALVHLIPRGRVTTYGAIARALGAANSARIVGYVLSASMKTGFPAHRVVNRNGLLTGKMHFGSPTEMADRLRAEGIQVVNDQVMNFEKLFWDPLTELQP